ncbi:MAG: hypothetical protein ABJJ53_06405 [Sulfitobacter sp.]
MLRTLMLISMLANGGTQLAAQHPIDRSTLVGQWDCNGRQGRGTAIRTLQEYRSNGHFYHLANLAIGDKRGRLDSAVALRGSWKMENGTIIEKVQTARMRSLSMNNQDISKSALGRRMAKSLPRRMTGPNKLSRTKVQFVSAREMKIVSGRIRGSCTKR